MTAEATAELTESKDEFEKISTEAVNKVLEKWMGMPEVAPIDKLLLAQAAENADAMVCPKSDNFLSSRFPD